MSDLKPIGVQVCSVAITKLGLSSIWLERDTLSKTMFDRDLPRRKIVWIEEDRFRGFACSACSWRFESSAVPTGKSFEEMMRNYELQRDKEFASHVCTDHPRTTGQAQLK